MKSILALAMTVVPQLLVELAAFYTLIMMSQPFPGAILHGMFLPYIAFALFLSGVWSGLFGALHWEKSLAAAIPFIAVSVRAMLVLCIVVTAMAVI